MNLDRGSRSRDAGIRDVVLLHGWGVEAGIWDEFAARFAPRFRIHAPDLPGYGSTRACTPYTLEHVAEAVAREAPRRCCVVGWSLGGQVALAWAQRAPRQVERMALIAATPCFVRRPGWPCAVAPAVVQEFARALAADAGRTLARFALLQAQGDARMRAVFAALKRGLPASGARTARALEGGLGILRDADLRGMLARVKQPTLVVQGGHDRLVPPRAGRRLAAGLSNARLKLLRGCAHAPFLSQPERLAKALNEFFDG